MPWDFLLLVFFINQFPPSLRVHIGTVSNFSKIRGNICSSRLTTGVVDTSGKWKKSSIRKILIILLGHLWIAEFTYIYIFALKFTLKVDGNEKLGRSKGRQPMNFCPALWRSRVILNLNISFLCKQYISVSACYSLIYRRCLDELAKRCKFWPKGWDHHNANSIGADVFIHILKRRGGTNLDEYSVYMASPN